MLTEAHFNKLKKESAISEAILKMAMIESFNPEKAFREIGLSKAGIGFPYFNLKREFFGFRLRKDEVVGDEGRYHQREGVSFHLYFLKEQIDGILDEGIPLIIVEGEKKLLSLISNIQNDDFEYVAIAFPGAFNWHEKGKKELAPILKEIPFKNRLVKFVPDSDYFGERVL